MFLNLQFVKFDTQDNLFREAFSEWDHQQNPDGSENKFVLNRINYKGKLALQLKSKEKIKRIYLNRFGFAYKVKKISNFEFIITSNKMQKYFDGDDNVEILMLK